MPWMSISKFKKEIGIGEPLPYYEEFFIVNDGTAELTLDMKKRYIRIILRPDDAVILLTKEDAKNIAKAIEEKLEEKVKSIPMEIMKDRYGRKTYGAFRDGQGVCVRVQEADSKHVFIETTSIPHLRNADAQELVRSLRLFCKKKGLVK